MKKAKVVLAQPAAGSPLRPVAPRMQAPQLPLSRAPGPIRGSGEEAASRASLKYRGLMQDYQEFLKETEAKKKMLHMEKLKKQRLLAEVKFLRKRFKSLSENPSQTVVCRVRNPAMRLAPGTAAWADGAKHWSRVHAIGSSSKGQLVQQKQDDPPRADTEIDLNEAACVQSYEMPVEDNHGYHEPLSIANKAKMYPMESDVAAGPSDVRMPAFWDVQNPAGRAGKRKISWQDQLALRV